IAVILIFLIGGALSLGHFFYAAHSIQAAVDVAAQEIARMPFEPTARLGLGDLQLPHGVDRDEDGNQVVMNALSFRNEIYDEKWLVVFESDFDDQRFDDYVNENFPLLNRLLASVMIFDPALEAYRYPGTVVLNNDDELTVLIPLVQYDADG